MAQDSFTPEKNFSKPVGVNFHGFGSAMYQNGTTPLPPQNYIEDSFRIFADNSISCVRVTHYWESWELDASQCYQDLNAIADAADKYGIMCIYDNHQWECSSWMGWGIGMPNSLLSSYYERRTGQIPDRNAIKDFWNRWWDRDLKTTDGIDGWDAQLNYIKNIVTLLKNRRSTLGFEILNEPEVFRLSDYRKVGHYHHYMVRELRKITYKPLFFCWILPHEIIDNPLLQALATPYLKDNVIYDGHAYPPSRSRMIYFKSIAILMGNVSLYIGEFNSGFTEGTTLTRDQVYEYINRFRGFSVYGCAMWRWSYIADLNIPAFNLTRIIDGRIQPNIYFSYLTNTVKEVNSK